MEENKIQFTLSRETVPFIEMRDVQRFALNKRKIFIFEVISYIASLILFIINFYYFTYKGLITATVCSLLMVYIDDITALIGYRKIRKGNVKSVITFDNNHISFSAESAYSELGYDLVNDITRTDNGVFLTFQKKAVFFFSNTDIEKCIPVNEFLSFIEERTRLSIKEKRHFHSNAVAFKIVASMLVAAFIIAPFTIFSMPREFEYNGCSIEMNKSYYADESDEYDALYLESSYEKVNVNIYNYDAQGFSDAYDYGHKVSSVIEVLEVFSQNIIENYDGMRLERNGEWVTALPTGMKVFKMKYKDNGNYIYGIFCIEKVGDTYYFVEFTKIGDFSKGLDEKIDKYISSINIGSET